MPKPSPRSLRSTTRFPDGILISCRRTMVRVERRGLEHVDVDLSVTFTNVMQKKRTLLQQTSFVFSSSATLSTSVLVTGNVKSLGESYVGLHKESDVWIVDDNPIFVYGYGTGHTKCKSIFEACQNGRCMNRVPGALHCLRIIRNISKPRTWLVTNSRLRQVVPWPGNEG